MKLKRPLTKAGAIINIILGAISTVFYGYASFAMYIVTIIALGVEEESSNAGTELFILFIVMLLIFFLSITLIVLSAIAIKRCKLNVQEFDKSKVIPALIIIVVLMTASHIYYLIASEIGFLSIISIILLTMTNLFVYIDLCKNKKALKNAPADALTQTISSNQPEISKSEETIEDRLIKLNNLKTQGLITEEEYQTLKKDLLK